MSAGHPPPNCLEQPRRELIEALQHCATSAEHCASTAVGLEGIGDCIDACRDAATLCRTSAELLARKSTFEGWALPATLMACEVCALECDYYTDAFVRDCARACRSVRAAADRIAEQEEAPTARAASTAEQHAEIGL